MFNYLQFCWLLAVFAISTAAPVASASDEVALSVNGRAMAVLLVPDRPSVSAQVGAMELKYHLDAITGANFEVLRESETNDRADVVHIHVGPTKAARAAGYEAFEPQEFIMDVQQRDIFLLGADEEDFTEVRWDKTASIPIVPQPLKRDLLFTRLGTVYAVHEFLHRVGVRWFMPVAPGIVVPENANLKLKTGVYRTKPWAEYRYVAGTNLWDPRSFPGSGRERHLIDNDRTQWWLVRNKVGGKPFAVNHSFYGYFDRFGKMHPEWWGSNTPSRLAHLEYSHPEFRAQVIEDARAFFSGMFGNPDSSSRGSYFGVVPNDSSAGWAVTDYSRKIQKEEVPVSAFADMDEAPPIPGRALTFNAGGAVSNFWNGRSSRYIWDLVNHVALEVRKTHPEGKIAALAYGRYTLRPPEFQLEPNVTVSVTRSVFIAPHPRDHAYFRAILQDWATQTKELYVWEYYCHQMFARDNLKFQKFPCITPEFIGDELNWLRSQNIKGYFYELGQLPSQGMPNIVEQMIPIYVTQRLLVDPNANGKELLEDFCRSMFGPAAGPMRRFVESLEEQFIDPENWKTETMGTETQWWSEMANDEKAQKWRALFNKAYSLAKTDAEKERIQLFDEAILQTIERHLKRFKSRFQTGKRLTLKRDVPTNGMVGNSGMVSITQSGAEWKVRFSDLPPGWQRVQVALDPQRRRNHVLSVSVARNGEGESAEGIKVSAIHLEKAAVSFRIQFLPEANVNFTPPKVWGGDFYVWSEDDNKPAQWSQANLPILDPKGFGVLHIQ